MATTTTPARIPHTFSRSDIGGTWLMMGDTLRHEPCPPLMPTTRPGVRPVWYWNLTAERINSAAHRSGTFARRRTSTDRRRATGARG